MSSKVRKSMIDMNSNLLSINQQCKILCVSRSAYYYRAKPTVRQDLELMRKIDELYLQNPCYGSRSISRQLKRQGIKSANRKRIQRLMRIMGIEAVYPKPGTTRTHPEHKIYPYLLRNVKINRPNQVWATDITYIPMERGFMYLVAVMDWYSRKILSWRVSNTLEASFCIDALNEAIAKYGCPEIFNTDQGTQFTCDEFIKVLKDNGIAISMDGKGRCQDNIFIERFWWTLKYQYIYLRSFRDGKALRKGLGKWVKYYNGGRGHSALDDMTPNEVYKEDDCRNQRAA